MSERITTATLEAIIARINMLTNSPLRPYEDVAGKYVPQAGCYHLSSAYGGVALKRMSPTGGAVDVLDRGHMPKRELAELMHAYIRGLNCALEMNEQHS
jgi:hypothetical protein